MEKKVLIFYGSYGAGHYSAACSIKEYIDMNYPNTKTQLVDCIEYISKHFNKITVKTYDKLSRQAPFAWKKLYYGSEKGPILKISSATTHLLSIKLYKLIKKVSPDLIISTHFFASEMCTVLKKRGKLNCKIATVLTDYAPHGQWLVNHEFIDMFFVAHAGMRETLKNYGVDISKVYATGIPLANKFLVSYDAETTYKEYKLDSSKTTILFFAGGSSHVSKNTTANLFKDLVNTSLDIQLLVITGKSRRLKEEFDKIVEENNCKENIKVLGFTTQVPQLMNISDLVITKPGGLTTTESLSFGLPIIAIDPIPGQEEENAQYLEKNGAGIWLKKNDNINNILKDLLTHPNKLQKMKNNSLKIAKPDSTKDICKILFEFKN